MHRRTSCPRRLRSSLSKASTCSFSFAPLSKLESFAFSLRPPMETTRLLNDLDLKAPASTFCTTLVVSSADVSVPFTRLHIEPPSRAVPRPPPVPRGELVLPASPSATAAPSTPRIVMIDSEMRFGCSTALKQNCGCWALALSASADVMR
eukprot:6190686-Pleurochrysis_carterae.AAC.3